MGSIAIPLPPAASNQDIEIDVRINGTRRKQNFRVEIFYWDNCQVPLNRAACIREILSNYDKDWQLYYIGMPTEKYVPITFVKKSAQVII